MSGDYKEYETPASNNLTPIEQELATCQRAIELAKTQIAALTSSNKELLAACESALDWFVSVAADGAPETTVRAAITKARSE